MENRFEAVVLDATYPQGQVGPIEPMTVVFSAGNQGPSANTIGHPALAKNVITVGSVDSYDPESPDQCGLPFFVVTDPSTGPSS